MCSQRRECAALTGGPQGLFEWTFSLQEDPDKGPVYTQGLQRNLNWGAGPSSAQPSSAAKIET